MARWVGVGGRVGGWCGIEAGTCAGVVCPLVSRPCPALAHPPELGPPPPHPPPARSWFTNFAKAADEVGVPVCMSLALVDPKTGAAADTRDFHVTGPAPKGRSAKSGGRR